MVEPWLRGTLTEFDAVRRQVLHALELAEEDCVRWCAEMTDDQVNARPFGMAPVAYHLRHIARSLDRLLTYAEGDPLSEEQLARLRGELEAGAFAAEVVAELRAGLVLAKTRVIAFAPQSFEQVRGVGREQLPSTVGALLVHCAEHTQRHVGQVISTMQVVRGMTS